MKAVVDIQMNDLISRSDLKEAILNPKDKRVLSKSIIRLVFERIDNALTVEITEEQAIDKLHETGWMKKHDKELSESRWIPVKTRELTEEERAELGESICFMWDCPLPDDGQEVLVSTPYGVRTTFFTDGGIGEGMDFEDYYEEDVIAWMPIPEPYNRFEEEDDDLDT